MSDLLLTPAELVELTGGLTQGAAQARFVRKHYGIRVVMGVDGRPKVLRSALDRRPASIAPTGPNFDALPSLR